MMPPLPEKLKRKGQPRSVRLLLLSLLLVWLLILGGVVALVISAQQVNQGSFEKTSTAISLTNDGVIHLLTQTAEAVRSAGN